MRSEDLLGTWSLESFVARSPTSEVFPLGPSPHGLITYSSTGYMAAVLMASDRPKFASGDFRGGTLEEIRQAFEGFDAYAGQYELDEEQGTVTHHAEVARFPNWEGTSQLRYARLIDGCLHLSTPPMLAKGQQWVSTLVWRRAGAP